MDSNELWLAVDAERARTAELLEGLSDVEWTHPSLCAGWTVRDVAAHLTLAPQITIGGALVEFTKARGSFHRMVHDTAVKQAALPTAELVALLRGAVGCRRLAPGQKLKDALMDVLVHTQDVALPLGRTWPMPAQAATTSADHLWQMGWPFHTQRRMRGLRLVATDVEWSAGDGAEVRGSIDALLMLLAGRTATVPQLTGDGVALVT